MTMEHEAAESEAKRAHPRLPANLRVRVAQDDPGRFVELHSRNLSQGGMFLQTPQPAAPGTVVRFEVLLSNGERVLRGTAQVIWTRSPQQAAAQVRPPGMGVEFRMLDEPSRALLERELARLKQRSAEAGGDAGAGEAERRRRPRVLVGMRVDVRCPDRQAFIQGYALNVSTGGVFVRTREPQPVGTRLQFDFRTADGRSALRGLGEVVWHAPPSMPDQRPRIPGMGIRFVELDRESQRVVAAMVGAGRGGPEPVPAPPDADTRAPCTETSPPAGASRAAEIAESLDRTVAELEAPMDEAGIPEEVAGTSPESTSPEKAAPEEAAGTSPASPESTSPEKAAPEEVAGTSPASPESTSPEKAAPEEVAGTSPGTSPEMAGAPEGAEPADGVHDAVRRSGPAARLAGAELRRWVVASLVAALELADLEVYESTDTVRSLLNSWCQDFFDGERVDLAVFWDLILSEEGVELADGALVMAIFQIARRDHGLAFELPRGLADCREYQAVRELAHRRLAAGGGFRAAVEQVAARPLETPAGEPERYQRAARPRRADRAGGQRRGRRAAAESRPPARSPARIAVAAVLLGLTLGWLIYVLAGELQLAAGDFDAAPLEDVLVLRDAVHKAGALQAFIADERWTAMEPAERRRTVARLAERVAEQDIVQLQLYDAEGLAAAAHNPAAGRPEVQLGAEVFHLPGMDTTPSPGADGRPPAVAGPAGLDLADAQPRP
jgi:uncharacterized protein (TIGR02266 family)